MNKVREVIKRIKAKQIILVLRRSEYFDTKWYLENYPDLKNDNMDPIVHYVEYGAKEGRNPGPVFNTKYYLSRNPDIADAGINPLYHYEMFGRKEARQINPENRILFTNAEGKTSILTDETIRFDVSKKPYLFNIDNSLKRINDYLKEKHKNNRTVVYTAIVDGYDELLVPEYLNPDFDYVCFTDRPISGYGIFEIRPIDYFNVDPVKSARYIKTHPHKYLKQYDTCIWVDSNIIIRCDLNKYVRILDQSSLAFGGISHTKRSDLLEESKLCKERNLDSHQTIDEQLAHYIKEGFSTNDLIETNFFICKPNDSRIIDAFSLWWAEIYRYSRRDQLSVNYAFSKAGLNWVSLMPKGISTRNNEEEFSILHHHTSLKKIYTNDFTKYFVITDPYSKNTNIPPSTDIVDDIVNIP